eukprot:4315897-Pyramimonas_sp.AAC.2
MTWLGSVGDCSEDVRVSICDRLREAFRSQYPDSRELDLAALEANIRLSRRGVDSITPEVHLRYWLGVVRGFSTTAVWSDVRVGACFSIAGGPPDESGTLFGLGNFGRDSNLRVLQENYNSEGVKATPKPYWRT